MSVPHSGDFPLTDYNCVWPAPFRLAFFRTNLFRLGLNGCLPALPVYADGQTGSARKEWLVADLRQVVFRQTGHFHHGTAVNAVLQHGTGNFQSRFALTF